MTAETRLKRPTIGTLDFDQVQGVPSARAPVVGLTKILDVSPGCLAAHQILPKFHLSRHTLIIFYKGPCYFWPRLCPLFFAKVRIGMALICPLFLDKFCTQMPQIFPNIPVPYFPLYLSLSCNLYTSCPLTWDNLLSLICKRWARICPLFFQRFRLASLIACPLYNIKSVIGCTVEHSHPKSTQVHKQMGHSVFGFVCAPRATHN